MINARALCKRNAVFKWARIITVLVAFLALAPSEFEAETAVKSIDTQADVDGALTVTVKLFKNDTNGPDVTSSGRFDFGELRDLGTGSLRSSAASSTGTGAGLVLVTVNSHGIPWVLTEAGSGMSSGTNNLPGGALGMKPVYAASDNGGITDGVLASPCCWVASTPRTVYTSDTAGPQRTIRIYHSITDDPNEGAEPAKGVVPINQVPGSYSGAITYTATV